MGWVCRDSRGGGIGMGIEWCDCSKMSFIRFDAKWWYDVMCEVWDVCGYVCLCIYICMCMFVVLDSRWDGVWVEWNKIEWVGRGLEVVCNVYWDVCTFQF